MRRNIALLLVVALVAGCMAPARRNTASQGGYDAAGYRLRKAQRYFDCQVLQDQTRLCHHYRRHHPEQQDRP